MERKNAWNTYSKAELKKCNELNETYMDFLTIGKTERECVTESIRQAKEAGYVDVETVKTLKAGDKVYAQCMNKTLALFLIGEDGWDAGMNILGAHIDSPRLDVKQNPLYENEELVYLDTHYYGGVKKYQWVTIPLAIHGVVVKKDGETISVNVGEKDSDPVFCISDLLIHLAGEQLDKKAAKVIEGEKLDVIIGNMPFNELVKDGKEDGGKDTGKDTKKDAVKANILKILKAEYGFEEEDFLSAELEVVPAGRAREMGFDRSMILSYGQDDRVCAYTSLKAMLDIKKVKRTTCCLLVDKEEIGSVGATGMQSHFFENTVAELMDKMGKYNELNLRRCLKNSKMLSSDVSAAYDPMFSDAFEKRSAAFFGKGVVFNKFTGSRGKSGSNDANAEYLAYLRKLMDDNQVNFQTAELGKVDIGGGGTIAYILSLYGMEVIDSGVAVLNMHAPWEITSKADVYEAYKCYQAFIEA